MTNFHVSGAVLLLGLAVSSPAVAQMPVQADDWLAWQGCWRAEHAPVDELLCVLPTPGGVRMVTLQRGAIVAESQVTADNAAREVRRRDCSGTEQAVWSTDRRRVFLMSDLTCPQGETRVASGLLAFVNSTQWLSVQAVTTGAQTSVATVRYNAAESSDLAASIRAQLSPDRARVSAARHAAAVAASAAAVSEAADHVASAAVEEWLRAAELPYELASSDADDDAGNYVSALDLVAGSAPFVTYGSREVVRAIERPAQVHRTYLFGGAYYGRYSPWGYDWYGWRIVAAPFVYIHTSPVFVSRSHGIHRFPIRVISRGTDRTFGRATRDGYTRDRDQSHATSAQHGTDRHSGRERGSRSSSQGTRQARRR